MGEGSSKIECPDCGRQIQEKNLRKHYKRNHPDLDPRTRLKEEMRSKPKREKVHHFDIKTSPVVPVLLTVLVVTIILIAGLLVYSILYKEDGPTGPRGIFFASSDGAVINATYYDSGTPDSNTIFLIHDVGQDRSVWSDFAYDMRDRGYNALAMDLRGHGESTKTLDDTPNYDWTTMTDDQMYLFTRDLEAAVKWLRGTDDHGNKNTDAGGSASMVGLGRGGLIVWDQASRMSRQNENTVKFVSTVIVSPALDCFGVDILQISENWGDIRPVMFAGGLNDGNSVLAIENLMERRPENGLEVQVESSKKGIDILKDHEVVRTSMYGTIDIGFEL